LKVSFSSHALISSFRFPYDENSKKKTEEVLEKDEEKDGIVIRFFYVYDS